MIKFRLLKYRKLFYILLFFFGIFSLFLYNEVHVASNQKELLNKQYNQHKIFKLTDYSHEPINSTSELEYDEPKNFTNSIRLNSARSNETASNFSTTSYTISETDSPFVIKRNYSISALSGITQLYNDSCRLVSLDLSIMNYYLGKFLTNFENFYF